MRKKNKQKEQKKKEKKEKREERTKRLPVTIITGALGSGKTTLINHILKNNKGLKAAVIVNEFGKIGIDNKLIVTTKENIIELSNGCICCQVRGDLIEMLLKIIKTHKQVNALIIETSGVANPVPVAQTFFLQELQQLTELDAIITVVDGDNFKRNIELSNGKDQIRAADIILFNKIDLITEKRKEAVKKEIENIAPHARIIETTKSEVKLQLILNIGQFDVKRFINKKGRWIDENHTHDEFGNHIEEDGIISMMFRTKRALDMKKFQAFAQQLPESIIRSKGIIAFQGLNNRAVYQQVGRRIDVKTSTPWDKGKKETGIIFIGIGFNAKKLKEQLKACLVDKN